ncbi:MAG: sodium:solute symporter, partial [Bacteroidetes bacterium]|nr:sodium:solute symporter [Bacteroidota bacterium]
MYTHPIWLLLALVVYFGLISLLAWWSNRRHKDDLSGYFVANRRAPWLMVAIGMVGSSLSGLTFISVPGKVGAGSDFTYFQVVMGNFVGYFVIAHVLLPLYYRLRLTSIYGYLGQRLGPQSYRSGAWFFLISRGIGSAVRLYLAVSVLQAVLFREVTLPFWLLATLTVAFIMLYTWRGGIRTVMYTDVLQTVVMVGAVIIVWGQLTAGESWADSWSRVAASSMSRMFVWDWQAPDYFFKS